MKAHLCSCGCGELIIEDSDHHFKAFVNRAHKQKAYRSRKRMENARSKQIGIRRRCLNCGLEFLARTERHVFHNDSCRVNYWQQMHRIALKEGQND